MVKYTSSNLKKKKIFKEVKNYFKDIDPKKIKPSKWKVPIGGGYYNSKEVNSVINCYLKGHLSTQIPVNEFENRFSRYIGLKYAVATNSGTSANILALNTLIENGELKKGDKIAIPATTFISVATPIIQLGLVPLYIDIKKDLNMDMDELSIALKKHKKIKCVMIVHTLGMPADMIKLKNLSKKNKFIIIEDCCEAHGATIKGKKIGSFGDISTWSFYVAHNMTTAEGGMVLIKSRKHYSVCSELREFGRLKSYKGQRYGFTLKSKNGGLSDFDERYVFHRIGWNFRMSDAPAAFGIEQLKKLEVMNNKRIQNAKFLINNLRKFNQLDLPKMNTKIIKNTFYSFPIIIKESSRINRKKFVQYLESYGIETRAIMCGTLPDQPCLINAPGISVGKLKTSRFIRDRAFFIGCHPLLTTNSLKHIVNIFNKFFTKLS
tara:strand:+ start:205 stop:1506 length:1302 start_codon:yes stop_codon:yes gene_type:complete